MRKIQLIDLSHPVSPVTTAPTTRRHDLAKRNRKLAAECHEHAARETVSGHLAEARGQWDDASEHWAAVDVWMTSALQHQHAASVFGYVATVSQEIDDRSARNDRLCKRLAVATLIILAAGAGILIGRLIAMVW